MNLRLSLCLAFLCSALASLHAAEPKRYVVTDLGAVGDSTTVNTKALQSAIDAISAKGGGLLVIPKGTFLSGALFFKPGVNLLIEQDGILKSTTKMADFPPIYTRWEGIERYWTPAFLNFIGMKNVEVTGPGLVDGSGDEWLRLNPRVRGQPPAATPATSDSATAPTPPASTPAPAKPATPAPDLATLYPKPVSTATLCFAPDPANLPTLNAAGIPLPRGRPSPPRAIVFQDCSGVHISELFLKNQARWGYVFIYCENVVAEKLSAKADHNIPSSDGMDVDSCRKVLITECYLECNDDCLSIKSGKDEDGRRVNRPCEDIIIEKTHFAYGHGGAAMGSETSGGIRRVEVRDCLADDNNSAPVRFKSQPTRGGVVEDITYRNFELRDVHAAFEFLLDWNMRIATPDAARMAPTVRHIRLINVHGTAAVVGTIHGLAESPITDVVFENCDITAQRGLTIDHVRDLDTSGLQLTVAQGDPIIRKD